MADVFISYARNNRMRVRPLVDAIEAAGWSVWWDPSISSGQEFDRRITAELDDARAVLVAWTPESVDSRWVRGEARAAAERGILIPVRFDEATLPIDMRAFHTIDLDEHAGASDDAATRDVLSALGALIGPGNEPAAARAASSAAGTAHEPGRVAICVLPFANMSGDPEQEYFSDGISEDIITDLSKVSALSVVARNSAFVHKGRHVDVTKVARALQVSHVLEGSVRRSGDRVRITAQLVDGASNDHVWAERYDRELKDIFALQDEISHAIVAALRVKLLPEEKRAIAMHGTDDVEAYNLYLMARQLYVTGHEGDVHRAEGIVRLCRRATEIDPSYAQAWALLALGQMILRYIRGNAFDDGMAAADRALALDPDLAEAHAIKARILSEAGQFDAAAPEIGIALRLDPESYEVNRSAAHLAYRQQRPGQAIDYFEKALRLMETDATSPSMLISCYAAVNDPEAAHRVAEIGLARARKALAQDPNNAAALGFGAVALASLGDPAGAREWMHRAMLSDPDNVKTRYNYACFLSVPLGETDEAIAVLTPIFETISAGMFHLATIDPDLAPLRGDPRFQALMAEARKRLSE